ncbi:COP9 signalosome complex subunit 12 [Aspergillus piperis CBS 112811]|uniref:COP9 signalosome complex subunit 12 n=1 Tax=Aspergillus piperis CBS 112811 TaxID=1448313 RepID=A0A8G1RDV0_9EURO|nr:COP9 signalosome complex subunit 12 [Aspergillus piperis CBS 112811]RAH61450.1 COP9 signalosome complex subunit 12 [Aspergillus piperis CBS 112811]
MATPTLDRFFASIADLVKARDGRQLQDYLQLEPPLPDIYRQMVEELRQHYPAGPKEAELLRRCETLVPKTKGAPWTAFPTFMKLYFTFLRDVNLDNLLETYDLLKGLLNQCVLALGDSQMGVIVLPTVLYLSKVLAKLAMGLDRRPDLIAHLLRLEGRSNQEEATEKVTLVEKSANVVREAFIKCLTDRSGTPGIHGKPEGKRIGIYLMANLCLKLLFQCGKLRNAEQMFASISAQSPPLKHFPASQRVTYLYYLGRYLFSNNLFYPAQVALQASYDQCHRQATNQKRVILTYLIPCNVILGRFPSLQLLQRPEAEGLVDKFVPICRLIARGDYIAFREHLAIGSPETEWFARKGILLALRNRCEILVWRSLARKVFIHAGFHGDPSLGPSQRGPPPYLYLNKLDAAVRWIQSQHAQSAQSSIGFFASKSEPDSQAGQNLFGSQIIHKTTDWDFEGLGELDAQEAVASPGLIEKYGDYLAPDGYFDAQGQWQMNPPGSLVDGQPSIDYQQYELDPYASRADGEQDSGRPTLMMRELESILASLLTQGLMRGFLTHKNPRLAIPGARLRGAIPTGFPNVWQTILAREQEDDNVPGWVQPPAVAPPPTAGGGRVVNLSGARPVGVQ